MQFIGNPAFKFLPSDGDAQIHAAVAEMELGYFSPRELVLDPLHRLVKVETQVLINKRDEGFDLFRFQGAQAGAF